MAGTKKKQVRVNSRNMNRAVRRGLCLYYGYRLNKQRRRRNSIEDAGITPVLVGLYLAGVGLDDSAKAVKKHKICRSAIGRVFMDLRKAGVSRALLYE